jgi:predicted ArsR family transcriptional regulator
LNQLTFAELEPPNARYSDPITSKQAASQAVALQADHCALILACLKRHGPASKDRIAALTRLTGTQVARRTVELSRAGLIRDTGTKAPSTAGRQERVWGAVGA